MQITDSGQIVFTDNEGKTQCVSKEELLKMKEMCANYERDNVEEASKLPIVGKMYGQKLTTDEVVEEVIDILIERHKLGKIKYNTTLQENNKDNYLKHSFEEQCDNLLYIYKLLKQKEDITQMVKDNPSDMELGTKIRKIYGI